jgi:hypothetical protein
MGGLAKSADETLAERSKAITAAKDDRAELERIRRDRDKLSPRPIGTIKAEIEAARASKAYKATDGCNPERISKLSRDACDAYRRLEGDLATAETAARLDVELQRARARDTKAPVMQTTDPGATVIAVLTGTTAESAAAWTVFMGSIALELAGMIAMMRAESRPVHRLAGNLAAPMTELQIDANSAPALTAETAGKRQTVITGITLIDPPKSSASAGTVGRFMLACLKRVPGEEAQGGAIYARYQRWCGEQQPALTALDPRPFELQFAERCDRLAIRTRRDGGRVYCLDVKLVA